MATLALHFLCSVQRHSQRRASPPLTQRHASSTLASSLLRHPMHTPYGAALMALTNQGLPPCLISLTASQQLELLAATPSSVTYVGPHEDVLHRRIVELKDREKRQAVQEILFALVASKLLHVMMALPHFGRHTTLQSAQQPRHRQGATLAMQTPCLDDLLQAIHAPEVQPLTSWHVDMVINGRKHADNPVEPNKFAHVHKFELGKIYAASVMQGYFLARVHQRFKLEQRLQVELVPMEAYSHGLTDAKSKADVLSMGTYIEGHGFQDECTIRRISSLSCPLTLSVIEHHCEAMFGSVPCQKSRQVQTSDVVIAINIQLGFVRTLIYQALAFGALLWDTEHNFRPLLYPHVCQEH